MNWVRELCDLYEKNKDRAGKVEAGRYGEPLILLPIYHTTVAAQITVTISEEGKFLRAEQVSEEDKLTVIPTTEKSAARTAGVEPHPLCDNLKYLAGDYMEYVIPDKGKDFFKNHKLYMEALEKWAVSPLTHKKVTAICRYLQKKELMKDLIAYGMLKVDENGKVQAGEKIQKVAQPDAFVRFRIEKWDEPENILDREQGAAATACWLDCTLHDAYILYSRSLAKQRGLSYLTGDETQITYLHPKKIRNEGDGAKLISANDKENFTFRGRFTDKEEAFSIGYDDSQKTHNALKWIIRKQGRTWNGFTVVTWESDLNELPDWGKDTDSICDDYEDYKAHDGWDDEEDLENKYQGTNPMEAARFQAVITGYKKNLNFSSNTMLMAFDAATTGRLAMMECQALLSSTYLDNLRHWHEDCGWLHPKFKNKTYYLYYGMVSIKDIANALYGVENNDMLSLKGSNEGMYSEVCKRLIPCMMNRREIPKDMVRLSMEKASSPVSYEKPYNWERVLALACSLVRKEYIEKTGKKEEWTVALNKESQDRNYLYGRLLAVADRIEYRTFDKDENRQTNAKRYMNGFSGQPFRTWKVIEERLQPYFFRLSVPERLYYERLIQEICWKFQTGEFEKNDGLNGLYLLGFHNQAYALQNKTEEE